MPGVNRGNRRNRENRIGGYRAIIFLMDYTVASLFLGAGIGEFLFFVFKNGSIKKAIMLLCAAFPLPFFTIFWDLHGV